MKIYATACTHCDWVFADRQVELVEMYLREHQRIMHDGRYGRMSYSWEHDAEPKIAPTMTLNQALVRLAGERAGTWLPPTTQLSFDQVEQAGVDGTLRTIGGQS